MTYNRKEALAEVINAINETIGNSYKGYIPKFVTLGERKETKILFKEKLETIESKLSEHAFNPRLPFASTVYYLVTSTDNEYISEETLDNSLFFIETGLSRRTKRVSFNSALGLARRLLLNKKFDIPASYIDISGSYFREDYDVRVNLTQEAIKVLDKFNKNVLKE